MKKILLLFLLLSTATFSQLELDARPEDAQDSNTTILKTAACGSPYVSSGYPAWTNYWAGYQINLINTSACPIIIYGFEARFQGTSGYRIYTKAGSFVGFETTAGAWTLVGQIAGGLTGLSTVAPTPIPIPVNIVIPAGATQAFYLTRTDNLVANRHLYVPGSGTPGTTVYASDANLSITEGSYIDPFFAFLNIGTRRPSLDVCYDLQCTLPVELAKFWGEYDDGNVLRWVTASEVNNDYFNVERSFDGVNWEIVGTVDGAGNSSEAIDYEYVDRNPNPQISYYRLVQVDYDRQYKYSDVVSIVPPKKPRQLLKSLNLLGQPVTKDYTGTVIQYYDNNQTIMIWQN